MESQAVSFAKHFQSAILHTIFEGLLLVYKVFYQAVIYLFNGNTRKTYESYSKLTIHTTEQRN